MESTAIILAGGKSSRMGTNKALLPLKGKTVIENIVDEVKEITSNIMIVTNTFHEYEFLNLPLVEDIWKGKGPLAGIHAGLKASRTENNLLIACDMPFISSELGKILLNHLHKWDAVVPKLNGQLHPLFAAYKKGIVDCVERSLKNDERRIRSIFQHVHVRIMDENELKKEGFVVKTDNLFNMNHPEEYEQAKNILRGRE